jgi:hypothetical protein
MPICPACQMTLRDRCDDRNHQRLYRSYYCQHRTSAVNRDQRGQLGADQMGDDRVRDPRTTVTAGT